MYVFLPFFTVLVNIYRAHLLLKKFVYCIVVVASINWRTIFIESRAIITNFVIHIYLKTCKYVLMINKTNCNVSSTC